ncbi:MAG: tetratricopeptide repeat protein [bacterium]|nr:tetratricopeptide repeat protein [bacterium]
MNDDASNERREQYSRAPDFARIAEEFESLRALGPEARDSALAAMATTEPQLATELRRLFAQHSEDPDELASPTDAFGAAEIADAIAAAESSSGSLAASPPPDVEAPETIGPYRAIRELGRGGMGTVYLGEREGDDFTNRVAIKLLRAAGDDREMQRRFRTERRILAGLVHPHIATLFDGGTTTTGQPYVVMEYVDGPDLLTFCRERRLALRDRLRLFVKVCRAVAHAHRALVVHRDLKPGNILVGQNSEPKLLDFGIAKLLQDGASTDASLAVTHTGHMLLTPEYSSPEQVRGGAITTATDVYALGVILYELLSGQRAQPLANRSVTQLVDVVCDRTPPPPSAVRATDDAAVTTRELRGDLDTIVACAMRKEAERRYESAAALADDLEAFLAGLPVAARGDTLTYRTQKFVRRHSIALAGTALLFVLLVTFAVTTAMQNRRIADERDAAITQRIAADELSEFLVDLFDMASPDPERAETLRARELLDRGARRIATEMTEAPHRRAPVQLAMGRAYVALGLYDAARPLLTAAERATAAHAPDSRQHRRLQYWNGVLAFFAGETERGEQLLRRSLEPTADGKPCPTKERIEGLNTLASHLRDRGRFGAAIALVDEAATFDENAEFTDMLQLTRAEIARDRGDGAAALAMLEQLRSKAGDDSHPRYTRLHRELGRAHRAVGDVVAARAAFEQALALAREFAGDSHPDVDTALFSLAMLEIDRGDMQRAETLLREILARDEARFGTEHSYPALTKGQLAMVLGNLDRNDEAEQLFRAALETQRRTLPEGHPELPTTIANLGSFYHRLRRHDEAAPLFAEALELRQQLYEADHPIVLTSRNQLAVLELDRGNHEVAEREFRAVLAARRDRLGTHREVAGSLLSLGTAVSRQGRHAEAVPIFEESVTMFEQTLEPDHPTLARPLIGLAIAWLRQNEPKKALPGFRSAAGINARALGEDHFQTSYARLWLGRCLGEAGDREAAVAMLRALVERLARTHPGHPMGQAAANSLAALERG